MWYHIDINKQEDNKMRYEITASKGADLQYKKTSNPVEAQIAAWELRMKGYKNVKITINEK